MTKETINEELIPKGKILGQPRLEPKRSIETLPETGPFYRTLFETANDSIFILEDYKFVVCNKKTLEMFGCRDENEILGSFPWDFSPLNQPDGSPSKEKAIEMIDAASKSAPQRFFWKHVQKSGREFDTEISINPFEIDGKKLLQAIVREITEIKQTKEALRKTEEEYRTLFDMVSDALALIEISTGNMLDVNKAFIELYGYEKEEVLKMKNTDFSAEPEKTKQVTQARDIVYIPVRYHKKKDGTVFPTEIAAKIFKYHGKEVHIAAIRDITIRQRYETQLQRSRKMDSLGLLASGVAHDLNNILSGIVTYPELLLLDLPEDSRLRKPIETIQESGYRAAAIVEDLLTIARGVATSKQPLSMNNLIKDYLDSPEFRKLKEYHPTVSINSNLDYELPNIFGSHIHIRKVIMNLVSNAVEAIESSGQVEISTLSCFVDSPLKGYNDLTIGEYAVLSIRDNGSGISECDIEQIFEPFYTKKVMGRSGTGLGLAVVWNVVQDHSGYIDVKSDVNGTNFDLYFPISRDVSPEKPLPISLDNYKGNGETILVVDDVKSQREIACNILEVLGYKTRKVSSGEEAITFLDSEAVDLVLLDMIMEPGLNGRETYAKILKIHPNQKAVIVSGFAETNDVKEAQNLGAGRYIKKPYSIEKIGLAIKNELNKS